MLGAVMGRVVGSPYGWGDAPMTAVLTRARAELRARAPSMLALTLLVGIGSAAVMTLAAGARRTDTAYPRFARAYKAADMLVYPQFDPSFAHLDFNAVSKLPQVSAAAQERLSFAQEGYSITVYEPPYGLEVDRLKMLEGRLPTPTATDEVAVPYWVAKAKHLHLGQRLTVSFGTNANTFIPTTLRIVGIEAAPGEFPPQISNNGPGFAGGSIHISPATFQALKARDLFSMSFLLLRFKNGGADNQSVNSLLNKMAIDPKTGKVLPQLNDNLNEQAANVQRSIHLQAVALWLVAGLVALITVLVLSQLLARQATIDSTENPTLLALGMTRTQVWLTGMGRALLIGVAGAAIGVVGAYFASTLMPIGVARIAEPNPGFHFDPALLGIAAAVVIALILLLAAWPVWNSSRLVGRETPSRAKPSLAARAATISGFSPAAGTGVRHALESGHGRTQVPVRSSLLSIILAIVALAGALTFGAGLDHLLSTPRLYGTNWDAHLTTDDSYDNKAALSVLLTDPRVQDVAQLDSPPVILNGKRFDIIGLEQTKGRIEPVVINGHAPELPDEVGLGVKTMHDTHVKIGDNVKLTISAIEGSPPQTFKVVGSVVLPPNSDTARLGTGAALTEDGVKRMAPPGFTIPVSTELYITFSPGVNKKAALADIMSKEVTVNLEQPDGSITQGREKMSAAYGIINPTRPSDLVNFGQVQNLPLLLAGLVGLLAAATLAHTLVTSIRRKRRDLAILKMLGFVPRQVRWAVAPWQATTFISTALLIGIPLGIATGRLAWSAFTTNLGTLPEPVTPSVRLLLAIAGAIVLANLVAAVPAVIAGRMRPAPALRAE